MRIESIAFENFRALRDCSLPVGRVTLLVGANGSGKTTVLNGLRAFRDCASIHWQDVHTKFSKTGLVRVRVNCVSEYGDRHRSMVQWSQNGCGAIAQGKDEDETPLRSLPALQETTVYTLSAESISAPAKVRKDLALSEDGLGLAAVLDRLKDRHPEQWKGLVEQIPKWFPEFDEILFDAPTEGEKSFSLRRGADAAEIPAHSLSQGTLIALAMLTIAYIPTPRLIVGFEEIDRGLHPRLMRDVQQALYRLAYPEQFGESREPVQVIATTHSPYLLDLFKDRPEEVVVCEKLDDNVRFTRLSDMPNVSDIVDGASLGEVWYSGALGGVPAGP